MEILGIFKSLEAAATAVNRLITAGVAEDRITSLSSVPYPQGVLIRAGRRPAFYLWTLACGACGALSGFALAAGTAWLYPLRTGDKPIISIFPVGLITYELMMLFAIIGTLIGMFRAMGLPDFQPRAAAAEIADGAIGILVTTGDEDELIRARTTLLAAGAERLCAEEEEE
jgi:hypothetical protein